jgi:PAS domain S-box-containing protein
MDTEEIYAPIRERLWLTIFMVFLFLAGVGSTVLLLWRRQSHRFFQAQYEATEMLRENERRLSEFQQMAQLGHWIWDIKTGSVEWSEEVFKIFHLDPDKFTPHIDSIMALSPWPEDKERDRELIRKAIETHEKGSYEQRFLLPDKNIGHYYSTFQGKYDEGGNLVSIVGTVLDTTERKRAEELLRESEERYRSLFENSLLGISAAAPDGHLMYVNQAYAKMYGYDNIEQIMAEVVNVGSQLYANSNQRKEVLQILNEKGIMEPREVDVMKRDGTRFFVLVAARSIKDTSGKLLYYEATHLDITKRKWAEEEILRLNAELEQRVAQRTAELSAKTAELEKINKVFVNRELRMRELKARIAELEKQGK